MSGAQFTNTSADQQLAGSATVVERPPLMPGAQIYRSPCTVDTGAAMFLPKLIWILGSVLQITCDFFAKADGTHFPAPQSPVHYDASRFKYSFAVYYPQGYLRATARIYRLPSVEWTDQDHYTVEFMCESGDRNFMRKIFSIFQDVIEMKTDTPVSMVLKILKRDFDPRNLTLVFQSSSKMIAGSLFYPSDEEIESSIQHMAQTASSYKDDRAITGCVNIAHAASNWAVTSANLALSPAIVNALIATLFGRYTVATKSMAACALNTLFDNTRVAFSTLVMLPEYTEAREYSTEACEYIAEETLFMCDRDLDMFTADDIAYVHAHAHAHAHTHAREKQVEVLPLLKQMSTVDSLIGVLGDEHIMHFEVYHLAYYCGEIIRKIMTRQIHRATIAQVHRQLSEVRIVTN